ncbi:hypothetical protein [Mycolicibacter kumamotonensis]|uniref:Uncharacterized protein n=1 Tax=Mycolicibacter kumamotonensis TaxID=354243 RepID=A0A1B8SL47_9MYCO|nr:hypothetical protein [Mycolicibacter kumamotonensis]OBY33427.1 hypothetical protein ACT18_00235 [Mycolicibacter kumamotonensis]
MRTHSICEHCHEPVHTDGDPKRGWIHTQTDRYTCHDWHGNFALPLNVDAQEEKLETAYDEGYAAAEGIMRDEHEAESLQEGRRLMYDEILDVLNAFGEGTNIEAVRSALLHQVTP